jgi:acyl-CoA synthetase (AMP-forming)/AMP-acid ligase II
MSGPLDGLKQVAELAKPKTLKTLRDANALDPKAPLAMARSFPWLLGRGPSLGILTRVNGMVLGDKPAIIDRNGSISWKELDDRSNQVAHLLEAQGLEPGDRVGILLRNGREIVEMALGCQKVGIVACPFNTWAKPKELKATLDNADVSLMIYDTGHAEQIEAAVPSDMPLLHVGDDSDAVQGSESYETLRAAQSTSPPSPFTLKRGAPKVVIHTSGTTGTPKGASRDAAAAGIGALVNLLSIVPYKRDDIVFCPAPMFHSFGLITFVVSVALGATMVLPEKFDPEQSLMLISKNHASAASFVPVMIRRIVQLDEEIKNNYDLTSLRVVMASGSAMSEDLRKAGLELFGDVLYDLYGSTEVGWVTIARPEDMKSKPKSVGKPVPGVDIAIFSKDGERLEAGETGELFIKSDFVFEGYTTGESKEEREGYMGIGDLGHFDEDGFLYVEARSDDMVVVGGENIYPIEVEQVIEDIPGVDEVAVLGVEDDEYGQVLAAFVVGSTSEDEITKHAKAELASYKVPKRIEIVDELPRTSTGKVLKRELIVNLEGAEPLDDA